MTNKKIISLHEMEIQADQVVLCRVDFNVPMNGETIRDDHRIRAALPTIKTILDTGAKLVLCSHLGRPRGQKISQFSLLPAAERLAHLLEREVIFAHDGIGTETQQLVHEMVPNGILMLENLRFYPEEKSGDGEFAQQLASLADVFVNDAFGAMHREHASITGVPEHLEGGIGLLVENEIAALGSLLSTPDTPFGAVMGGAKVSDKITVIEEMAKRVDHLFIGGAMAYTFLAAKEIPVGKSKIERSKLDLALNLLAHCEQHEAEVHLPVDHVVAKEFSAEAPVAEVEDFAEDDIGLDIGPETVKQWTEVLTQCKTLFWNGPLGVFEWSSSEKGTKGIAEALASAKGYTVVGGGDSAAAALQFEMGDRLDHISTGGGAALEYLQFGDLPGLYALRR